jgi:hypothetical protein
MPEAIQRTTGFVKACPALRRTPPAAIERRAVADPMAKVQKALERVRAADAKASKAREDFRRITRKEVDEGRLTKAGIARELGISRQRVQELLQER